MSTTLLDGDTPKKKKKLFKRKEIEVKLYNWKPTAENINNLPEKIRDYIKELETVCDPAGIIQDNACLLENVKALTRKCKILKLRIDLMSFFVPADKMEKIEKDAEKAQTPR